ncbi:MAG: pyridoxal-phosphate dependent enzyme [Tissierellia bacterium]|nr:pyridoxal-phosphate dependent enzyme [Tissierellia bacterium]
MNISGKTPLMRSKKLEKYFGVKEIYLKLEGSNPFGHKFDRISELMIKDAVNHNKRSILVNGSDDYINSVLQFANKYDIETKIPLFKGEEWKVPLFPKESMVDFTHVESEDVDDAVEKYCKDHNKYNASNGYRNRNLSIIALQHLGEEIADRFPDSVSTVFTQLSYGYTVSSLYNGFLDKWAKGEINSYPQIFSCTIPKGNAIFDNYKENMEIEGLDSYDIEVNKYTRHLFTGRGSLLTDTLRAIHDTNGKIISVNEELLVTSADLLRSIENISLSTEEAYSFAGFYKMAKAGKLSPGRHVIILNDGKSDIDILRIKDFNTYSKEEISNWVKDWLQDYSDPINETLDAVSEAVKTGFILLALRDNIPQGICVVVNLGFSDFIPTYHLGYIATKAGNKGRGIATELINEAVDLTNGNLSLHVDFHNERATNLYEKFGFKKSYIRMIYSEEEI